jgi:hypothetical protein
MRIVFFLLGVCGLLAFYTAHTRANAVRDGAGGNKAIPAQAAPPSPGVDQCCDYQNGGTSGIHTYTCCNPHFGTCATTSFQGGSTSGDYCDDDGNPTGGGTLWGSCYAMPSQCDESMCKGATACQTYCSGFLRNRAICWSWTRCFRRCMANQVNYNQCTRPSARISDPAAAFDEPSGAAGLVGTGSGTGSGSGSGGSCVDDACSGSASCDDGDCAEPTCSGSEYGDGSGSGSDSCSCPDGYELVEP